MTARFDFHIHTRHLGVGDETMELSAIASHCRRLGVERIGITDHLYRPEQLDAHRAILADIRRLQTPVAVYFGAELNFTGDGERLFFSEEIKAELGVQYTVGGIHDTYLERYELARIIEIQHRHHLLACQDGLLDVLAHPYWFSGREFRNKGFPPFESVAAVPEAMTRELGQAARATGTAIEINAGANLVGKSDSYVAAYIDYLSILNEEGVMFSPASDALDLPGLGQIRRVWEILERLGVGDERIWRPQGRPIVGG